MHQCEFCHFGIVLPPLARPSVVRLPHTKMPVLLSSSDVVSRMGPAGTPEFVCQKCDSRFEFFVPESKIEVFELTRETVIGKTGYRFAVLDDKFAVAYCSSERDAEHIAKLLRESPRPKGRFIEFELGIRDTVRGAMVSTGRIVELLNKHVP